MIRKSREDFFVIFQSIIQTILIGCCKDLKRYGKKIHSGSELMALSIHSEFISDCP
jgi:hypothetical protein